MIVQFCVLLDTTISGNSCDCGSCSITGLPLPVVVFANSVAFGCGSLAVGSDSMTFSHPDADLARRQGYLTVVIIHYGILKLPFLIVLDRRWSGNLLLGCCGWLLVRTRLHQRSLLVETVALSSRCLRLFFILVFISAVLRIGYLAELHKGIARFASIVRRADLPSS